MFYNFVKAIIGTIIRLLFPIRVLNMENLPRDGHLILCSNHSNNLDPIFISIAIPRQISWMAKKELFNTSLLAFLLDKLGAFPVDRNGSDISAIKKALRVLKDNKVLGIFPEGTRTKNMNLENAKSGVSLLGVKSRAPILPVYIDSNYKFFRKTYIYVGKPIYFEKNINGKLSSEDYTNMSKELLSTIYTLKELGGK